MPLRYESLFSKVKRKVAAKRLVAWSPPSSGVLKFNVDGASKGNPGPCGAGGVIEIHLERFWVISLRVLVKGGLSKRR